MAMKIIVYLFFVLALFSCSEGKKEKFDFSGTKKKLIPVHVKMGDPQFGDWLSYHDEKNITLEQYIDRNPVRAKKGKDKIYIQPIGDFTAYELLLIQSTAEYLEAFYGLKTVIRSKWSDTLVPKPNRRFICEPSFTMDEDGITIIGQKDTLSEQLQTKYILYNLLQPDLPEDAVVMIALCNKDLYPDENYNFVFGQAALKERVGVWSFARFGDPAEEGAFKTVLLRTLKTASHETGHMFSIKHCSRYHCIMNGSNHLEEADRKPTALCPDCLEKFCWNFETDAMEHFKRLKKFWIKYHEKMQVVRYDALIKALQKP
jgi:archaemetzincin